MAAQVVKPWQLRRSMAYRPADGSWVPLPLKGLEEGEDDQEEEEEEEEDEELPDAAPAEVQYRRHGSAPAEVW